MELAMHYDINTNIAIGIGKVLPLIILYQTCTIQISVGD